MDIESNLKNVRIGWLVVSKGQVLLLFFDFLLEEDEVGGGMQKFDNCMSVLVDSNGRILFCCIASSTVSREHSSMANARYVGSM